MRSTWLRAMSERHGYAKALAFIVAAYALSPIDLIPDFIPVIGYLDDLILVPLGIFLAIRMIPPHIMAECRQKATIAGARPTSRGAAFIVVVLWIVTAAIALWFILSLQRIYENAELSPRANSQKNCVSSSVPVRHAGFFSYTFS